MYIYELTHTYYDQIQSCDIIMNIAVYSSKVKAEHAIKRLEKHPYFSKHPGEFYIDRWLVNKPEWTEGFV